MRGAAKFSVLFSYNWFNKKLLYAVLSKETFPVVIIVLVKCLYYVCEESRPLRV